MDSTILIIVAGAGILIGILIGLLINTLRGEGGRGSQSAADRAAHGIDNILLWHDRQGGNLIVDLDGSTFIGADQMHPEQRARLETCYSQLRRFLGIQDTTPRAEIPVGAAQPVPIKSQALPTPPPVEQQKVQKASPQSLDQVEQKPGNAKKNKPEPIKPLSIVGEIDDILQEMIAWSSLATRGLRVVETPEHTMNVILDVKQYQSIDEVPEPEVQAILREAVKRWESKPS